MKYHSQHLNQFQTTMIIPACVLIGAYIVMQGFIFGQARLEKRKKQKVEKEEKYSAGTPAGADESATRAVS